MSHPALDAGNVEDIHALFEALIAYMGDKWVSANIYANKETNGATNCGITCTDVEGNSFTYSERIAPPPPVATPAK